MTAQNYALKFNINHETIHCQYMLLLLHTFHTTERIHGFSGQPTEMEIHQQTLLSIFCYVHWQLQIYMRLQHLNLTQGTVVQYSIQYTVLTDVHTLEDMM